MDMSKLRLSPPKIGSRAGGRDDACFLALVPHREEAEGLFLVFFFVVPFLGVQTGKSGPFLALLGEYPKRLGR